MSERNAKIARKFGEVCGQLADMTPREVKAQFRVMPAKLKPLARNAMGVDIAFHGESLAIAAERNRQIERFTRPPTTMRGLLGLPPPVDELIAFCRRLLVRKKGPRLYPTADEARKSVKRLQVFIRLNALASLQPWVDGVHA